MTDHTNHAHAVDPPEPVKPRRWWIGYALLVLALLTTGQAWMSERQDDAQDRAFASALRCVDRQFNEVIDALEKRGSSVQGSFDAMDTLVDSIIAAKQQGEVYKALLEYRQARLAAKAAAQANPYRVARQSCTQIYLDPTAVDDPADPTSPPGGKSS